MAAPSEAGIDRFAFKGEDAKHALVHTAKRFLANTLYGPRISINTKCLRSPRVFSIKERHPTHAIYVGCKYGQFEGTVYGNDYKPLEGHRSPIARNEAKFRGYVENMMQDPAFREKAIKDLRGKHLLCWCSQDELFCHARVWLEIVNRPEYAQ